jgi:hypothetical protein
MTNNFLIKISEFLGKIIENKSGTLFSIEGIYVRDGKMIRVRMKGFLIQN